MEKFKVYIHHYYTYELFWLYCHGLEINPNDVPTWFKSYNRYNKNIKVKEDVTLNGTYKGKEIEVVFCNENHWDNDDGFHLFDYSISLLQDGLVSDRGFNSNLMNLVNKKNLDFLNSKVNKLGNKIHYLYIDWEGHDPYIMEGWYKKLSPKIQFFVDEIEPNIKNVPNHHFVFTNLVWSFIYPNTLGLRDYYFFGDYLKYKNDFKYKLNIPIRRLYGDKEKIADEVLKLNNPNISVTISSFGDENQITPDTHVETPYRDELIQNISPENYIKKRGYGIHDWGGEWNSNNMNENMWKMFGISDACVLFEHSPERDKESGKEKRIAHVGQNYITEKYKTPIFVTHWPMDIKSFYMKQCNDGTCECFDLLMPYGIGELIGASQREDSYGKLKYMMKQKNVDEQNMEFYLDLRKYGSCPHGGFGLGFDRLLMLITGISNIKDVIPFPVSYKSCKY